MPFPHILKFLLPDQIMQRSALHNLRQPLRSYTRVRCLSTSNAAPIGRRSYLLIGLTAAASGVLGFGLARSFSPATSTQILNIDGNTQYGGTKEFSSALRALTKVLRPEQISTELAVLIDHGGSNHHHHTAIPHRAVIYPSSTEDVVTVVNTCREYRIPIVPYSGGTSLEGHTSGVRLSY